ncbi:response regulator [Salinisphaera sp. SPP-AMP-43]|uniref:response regulator transcription factor n=1 Tax=Salinisphaera sp. SPP-AMP-43 TaxID=3121288 RepID=UPI003C6E61FE
MNLLIVDDDTAFTQTLVRALERLGHGAQSAATPEAAQALAEAQRFDAAVVDLRLGERSGLALIEPLLATDAELRILMLTGYASIATAIEAIKRGAFNYLPKPATARQILAALVHDGLEETPAALPDTPTSLRRLEWEHIQHVLAEHEGNVSATARALGMHRRTLQRKLAKKPVRE